MNHEKLKQDIIKYCKDNFTMRSQLARKAGISVSHMHGVLNGIHDSGDGFWMKIEKETNGQIKKEDYQ